MLVLGDVQTIILAAQAEAEKNGIRIVVSVFDNAGNLKFFSRMDGASSGSIQISQLKAQTAARVPISTRQLMERNASMPGNPYGGGAIPGIITLPGGFPLFIKGDHVGGIGVSGATPELDEQCCLVGVAAVSSLAVER